MKRLRPLVRRTAEPKLSEEEKAKRKKEYQHNWYLAHMEQVKAYQYQYNLAHKKSHNGRWATDAKPPDRPIRREAYTHSDLQGAPVGGRFERYFNQITSGEKMYVGVA
jgi:hypothetical protein